MAALSFEAKGGTFEGSAWESTYKKEGQDPPPSEHDVNNRQQRPSATPLNGIPSSRPETGRDFRNKIFSV
jgi:hypothetical protein